jgi:hypothetical protein
MDDATIQKIAAEIAAHLPSYSWMPLSVQLALIAIVTAVAVFASEYFRTRGRNLATKADFDSLQRQLHANTELVETIKAEIGQRDWAKREWTNLRRIKLEALLDKLHQCEEHLEQHRSDSFDGKVGSNRDPGSELDTLQILYFAELAAEVGAFLDSYRKQIAAGSTLAVKLMQAGSDNDARQRAYDESRPILVNPSFFQSHRNTIQAVKSAARKLLVDVMNVA